MRVPNYPRQITILKSKLKPKPDKYIGKNQTLIKYYQFALVTSYKQQVYVLDPALFDILLFSYYRQIQKALTAYKDEKRGPTLIAIQALMDFPSLTSAMPVLADFPLVPIHIMDSDNLYNVLDWQRVGSKVMLKHFLKSDMYFQVIYIIKKCNIFYGSYYFLKLYVF